MPANNTLIENRLWEAADELRANSRLRAADYSRSVLGLIFLRYAGHRFDLVHQHLLAERAAATRRLSDGGPDQPLWGAARRPSCHRQAHYSAHKASFNQCVAEIVEDNEQRFLV